ncbi:MAG TPA: DNA methyltransferase [Pirellulales bacterium]|nr:DNA methyltransferase [Pirellulales bacterium]
MIELRANEIRELILVNEYDWGSVEPSIFGTLFERTLDPAKRSQIGAHYTSRDDILTLLEPVVMAPLRREWADVKAKCDQLWQKVLLKAGESGGGRRGASKDSKPRRDLDKLLRDFVERLAHVSILDPACGSGNFLYVAINLLLDLEKEVITYGAVHGTTLIGQVRPTQLHGIEINPVAQQLAQVVIWIGYLQWKHDNGFPAPRNPVLDPIDSIELRDAIIDLSDPERPTEPEWPAADFIVGNPPFLGNRLIHAHLGGEYVAALSKLYEHRVGGRPDICCYWFEKARHAIERGRCSRAGLLATQGIRGGSNRHVLSRIKQTGDIFFAESDRNWVLDGANVHVSMIGFDGGEAKERRLDGRPVNTVNPDLTANADTTTARRLAANEVISFQGGIKRGSFDIPEPVAVEMLRSSGNPNGRPNSDVIVPYLNGASITRHAARTWIIDFGGRRDERAAAMFGAPFEHLRRVVYPERLKANQQKARDEWWMHWCTRPQMNEALSRLPRFLATARVSKYRVFVWLRAPQYPDCQLIVFARSDDYFFGAVHSRLHAVWADRQGTQVRERESGFRYTPTTCFETFPFPEPSAVQAAAIAEAAKELDQLRENWLNPPEWIREEILEFPGSVEGPWAQYVENASSRGIGTIRYRRTVATDEEGAKHLAKRTLTNLYNQRPAWLDHAHRRLDEAVFAAYGWPAGLSDDEILSRLLQLNLARQPVGRGAVKRTSNVMGAP